MEGTQGITQEITSVIEELSMDIVETQAEEEVVELSKDLQKTKKPRTQKQIDALKKAQETRKKNLLIKKEQKAQLKQAIKDNEDTQPDTVSPKSIMKRPYKKKPTYVYEDDPSSDEEQIIVVKRRKPKKKVKKKVVYEDPTSSEESEEEEEKPTRQLQKQKQKQKPFVEDEYSSDDDYGSEYAYPVNRPLRYADVFRFA